MRSGEPSEAMQAEQREIEAGTLVGDRYRVEAEIGQGGTAHVYRVYDERSGSSLALKRLSLRGHRSASVQAMFEREYHALVQLAHPRIICAFDYGFDGGTPFYTMELLDGVDARTLARKDVMPVQQVCTVLRDVASALALIHSRRLLHRDVSPRNVWCTPDGRAKLIDFGTLVAMGPQTRAAGTPPFVPPEAFYLQPLDARTDLYALGALGYYLLTRRYGYPARDLRELPELWERRPPRPEALRPELPSALCELVMALMSLDARGRPASAAEVLERLASITEQADEDERHVAQAFLSSPVVVGRDDVIALVKKRLRRIERAHGTTISVVAAPGLGRSRVLSCILLEARLLGITPIALDAAAAGSTPLALAALLCERLLEVVPALAAETTELATASWRSEPDVRAPSAESAPAPMPVVARVRKARAEITELLTRARQHARVLIAIDDVHRADAASLDVLARVSLLASDLPLALVTTCEEAALEHAPPALLQLVSGARSVTLTPLSQRATRELLSALFGEVAGLDETASFLHELSQGSPQTCMQYAQYLVDHGLAHYEGGRWELAPKLREQALPPTLDAMLEARLSTLSSDARVLALGLALVRDESRAAWQPEMHVRLEDFPLLLGIDVGARDTADSARATSEVGRAFAALDELLCMGMVQQRDAAYVLAHRVLGDALVRGSDEALRATMHERLATVLDGGAYPSRMFAIRQLQRAGRHARARERLTAFASGLGGDRSVDWLGMRVSITAACAKRALADCDEHGGTPREAILLRRMLLLTSAVYDWSLTRYGPAQLHQLRSDAGLLELDGMDPAQPMLARVLECLKRAQQRFDATPEAERGFAPGDAVRELASCALPLQAALANSHDVVGVRTIPAILEPLRPLSPVIGVIADLCQLHLERLVGRELGDRTYELGVTGLVAATGLPEVLRRGGAAINVYTQTLADARKGRARALELIAVLPPTVGDDMFLVVHARWLAYAFRGDAERARPLRKQLEAISEDDIWRRKASLSLEAELHALTGDLGALHAVIDELAQLAASFPGFAPWAHYARAQEHRLRGELDEALAELEAALLVAPPGEHCAYLRIAPAHAGILLRRGEAREALQAAQAALREVAARGLDRTAEVALLRVSALAHAALHAHAEAREQIERALALAAALGYDGLPLAALHEADARVALGVDDVPRWVQALSRMRSLLEHAHAPSLIQAYESLREDGAQTAGDQVPEAVIGARTEDLSGTTETDTHISSRRSDRR